MVRVFVVTTYGATVKAGGVRPAPDKPGQALAELTALAAEVAAGKLSSARTRPRAAERLRCSTLSVAASAHLSAAQW